MSEFSLGVAPTALYLDNDALEDTYYRTAGIQKKKKEVEVEAEAVKGGEEGSKKEKDKESEDGSSASKGKLFYPPFPSPPYIATHYLSYFPLLTALLICPPPLPLFISLPPPLIRSSFSQSYCQLCRHWTHVSN